MKSCGKLLYLAALAVMAVGLGARAADVTVTANFPNYVNGPGGYYGLGETLYSNYYDIGDGLANSSIPQGTVASIYTFNHAVASGTSGDPFLQQVNDSFSAGSGNLGNVFQAICIDLTTVTAVSNGVGIRSEQAHAMQYLWTQHFGESKADNTMAAEFQMAVWDLLYNGPSTRSNQFSSVTPLPKLNYGGVTLGSTWADEAWVNKGSASGSVYALVCVDPNASNPSVQSFAMALVPGAGSPNPLPLPASAGVGFGMLGGFGALFGVRKWLSRRRRIA